MTLAQTYACTAVDALLSFANAAGRSGVDPMVTFAVHVTNAVHRTIR